MSRANKPQHRLNRKSRSNGGKALREGVTYTATAAHYWQLRRALLGRTDQIELVCDGVIVKTTGQTRLSGSLFWLFTLKPA